MDINMILKKIKRYRKNDDINIEELKSIIKTNERLVLVDIRSPQEYNEGHLNRGN